MLNQVILAGRITGEIKTQKIGEKNITNIVIAVPRSFKNLKGEYESDFISCIISEPIGDKVIEYCQTGDIVGIKGRVQSTATEENGEKKYYFDIIAEKVTFLSSRTKEE